MTQSDLKFSFHLLDKLNLANIFLTRHFVSQFPFFFPLLIFSVSSMFPFTCQGAGNGILHLASFDTLAFWGLFQVEHIFSSSPIGRVLTYDRKNGLLAVVFLLFLPSPAHLSCA